MRKPWNIINGLVYNLANNLKDFRIYVGEFDEFLSVTGVISVYFKEHPLIRHYKGYEVPTDWMFSVKGYYHSFFNSGNKC